MDTMELRPMTLGEVLDRTFSLYKGNFLLFAGIFAIPDLLVVFVSVLFTSAVFATRPQAGAAALEIIPAILVLGLTCLLVLASAQAATVVAVSDLYLGRGAGLAKSYLRVRGRIVTVLLVMFLVGLMAAASMALLMMVIMPLLIVAKVPGWLAVLLPLALVFVVVVIVLCRTSVAVPAATLEPIGAAQGISRSFQLTKGSTAQIFAVYVLVFFLSLLSIIVFQGPFLAMAGSPLKPHVLPLGMRILQGLASWVSGVIVAPIGMIAFSLIYYNQRVRKEAFDLEKLMATLETDDAPASPSLA